jgi:hypothetical protein
MAITLIRSLKDELIVVGVLESLLPWFFPE